MSLFYSQLIIIEVYYDDTFSCLLFTSDAKGSEVNIMISGFSFDSPTIIR